MSNGDSIGLSCVGNRISGYYKSVSGAWTLLGSVIDSTYPNSGYIGFSSTEAATVAIDNFGGGSLNVIRKSLTSLGSRIGSRQAHGDN